MVSNTKLACLNKHIKLLRYKVGDNFNGKHGDDTHVEEIDRAVHKSLLILMIYLNDDYKGGDTTICRDHSKRKTEEVEIVPKTGKLVIID